MFWEIFYDLCIKANKKPLHVVNEIGSAAGSITKWKNGGIPNGITLIKISKYFGVSIDYLLGNTDTPASAEETDEKRELLNRIARMDEGQLKQLSDFADYLIDKKK